MANQQTDPNEILKAEIQRRKQEKLENERIARQKQIDKEAEQRQERARKLTEFKEYFKDAIKAMLDKDGWVSLRELTKLGIPIPEEYVLHQKFTSIEYHDSGNGAFSGSRTHRGEFIKIIDDPILANLISELLKYQQKVLNEVGIDVANSGSFKKIYFLEEHDDRSKKGWLDLLSNLLNFNGWKTLDEFFKD